MSYTCILPPLTVAIDEQHDRKQQIAGEISAKMAGVVGAI